MDWARFAAEHEAVAREVTGRLRAGAEAVARGMAESLRDGGKVMACGNGGSAADAQHFAAELVNRFLLERRPLGAVALTTDSSVLTSIANDYEYGQIFSKQVEALGRAGDWLLAISTSGNSDCVCRAAEAARGMGVKVAALCGGSGGRLAGLADAVLCVESSRTTARIQEGHGMLVHALCEMVEAQLCGG